MIGNVQRKTKTVELQHWICYSIKYSTKYFYIDKPVQGSVWLSADQIKKCDYYSTLRINNFKSTLDSTKHLNFTPSLQII